MHLIKRNLIYVLMHCIRFICFPSPILEIVFIEFMEYSTILVAFSFDVLMYRQIDWIAISGNVQYLFWILWTGFADTLKILCAITDKLMKHFEFLTGERSLRLSMDYWMNCIQHYCLHMERKTTLFLMWLYTSQTQFFWLLCTTSLIFTRLYTCWYAFCHKQQNLTIY